MRLKAMAQERADTMDARMSRKTLVPGQPRWSRAATAIDASAKGNAKTVWENLTNSPHFRTVETSCGPVAPPCSGLNLRGSEPIIVIHLTECADFAKRMRQPSRGHAIAQSHGGLLAAP